VKPTRADWRQYIDAELGEFQQLGVEVVRWFILADGWTYVTPGKGPKRGEDKYWHMAEVPSLSAEFIEDFRALLAAFEKASQTKPIYLLPSFISFEFCQPGRFVAEVFMDYVKGGRADAVLQETKRKEFLDRALGPLLAASKDSASVIFAWELMNEPEVATLLANEKPSPNLQRTIPADTMRVFLKEGIARIRQAGFKSTIGFQRFKTLTDWPELKVDYPQFHYYPEYHNDATARRSDGHVPPTQGGGDPLQPSPFPNCFVGEMASRIVQTDTGVPYYWPGMAARPNDLYERLCWVQRCNYPLTLLWEVHQEGKPDPVNVVGWSTRETKSSLQEFTRGLKEGKQSKRSCTP
jgi:hypothetical protein